MELKPRYVIDDENRKVAVQIDIDTFEKLEEILEKQLAKIPSSKRASIEQSTRVFRQGTPWA